MRVYWSRCGTGHGNFGDKLTPMLLRHHGIPCEWAPPEHAELIGIGSVLEKVPETFRGTLWTTGFKYEQSRGNFPAAKVLAVRGKLTRDRIQCSDMDHVAIGDAGLLCDEFLTASRKRYKLGVIPHFVDADDPSVKAIRALSGEISIIDVCAETKEVIRSAGECEHILSSSLHGLILADSLGIPNRWIQFPSSAKLIEGAGFKFRDYYSNFDITPKPFSIAPDVSFAALLESIPAFARPGIDQIKERLRGTVKAILELHCPPSARELADKATAQAEWREQLRRLQFTVARHIPPGSLVVIADDDQLRFDLRFIRTVPFLERDGTYWGPPGSDADAIAELERLVIMGVEWFVIAWPMYWLLDRFDAFARYLTEHFETRARDQSVMILRVRK
jgi:pyruvyltransferase